jgi:ligand-binding SRPBCC domain-containing protein
LLSKDASAVFALYEQPDALKLLTPPGAGTVLWAPPVPVLDSVAVLQVQIGPVKVPWASRIASYQPPVEFTDVSISGPFKSWQHRHGVEPDAQRSGTAWIDDHLQYELPAGKLGDLVAGALVRHQLKTLFRWRHRQHAMLIGARILEGFAASS